MADPNLTESAWQKAKDDTAGALKTPAFGIGATIMGLLFASAALIASEGQPVTTQVGASLFFGVLSLAVTVSLVFLVQLAAAPVRQRNELRQSWDRPEPDPVQPVNVGLSLRDFRRRGDDLLNGFRRGYETEDEETAERWTREAIQFLSQHCDPAVAQEFIDASQGETAFFPAFEARISALGTIIAKLG